MVEAPAPTVQGNGIAGVDHDPYKDQTVDTLVLIFAGIPALSKWIGTWSSFIPFHNYRQWHVFQNALVAGWNEGVVKKFVVPKFPDCPILWQDVRHYWYFGCLIGTIAYEMVANLRFIIAFVALMYVKIATGSSLIEIAQLLVKLFPLQGV